MNKKQLASIVAVAAIAVLVTVLVYPYGTHLFERGSVTVSFTTSSIHTTITITKDGTKIFDEYHAGVITQLGMNVTLAKLTGNITAYNATQIPLNLTYISIGNNTGTLGASSTVLPNEWNRTAATMHDCTYNTFNLTAVFVGASASQTADCIGVNFEADIANNALWGYDTFTEVSGIDGTFTITIEMKVTVA